jgi:uncharacterized coiled-coil protein SlyX
MVLLLGLAGCHQARPERASALEAKLSALEKRIEQQEEFITKAKEVLASHRAHILDLENRVEVTRSRLAATQPLPRPTGVN